MARSKRTKKASLNQPLINALNQATSLDEKLAICHKDTGNLNTKTLHEILQHHPDLDAGAVQTAKTAGKKERDERAKQQRVIEKTRQLRSELENLTPTKRLDLVLKEERKWLAHKDILAEFSITEENIEKRKADLAARKTAKKEKEREKATHLISQDPFSQIGAKVSLTDDDTRPVSISLDMDTLTAHIPEPVKDRVRYALKKAFKGTVENYTPYSSSSSPSPKTHTVLTASFVVFTRLAETNADIERNIRAIQNLTPGHLDHINASQATELSGLSRATFDSAVKANIIPVASTEEFRKWGRTLTANRFEIKDILEAIENGELERFQKARETKKKVARKKGAKRAQETRTWRAQLREHITQDTRERTRQIVRETGSFAAAHHLELFTWAQRASRLAKTKPSQSEAAYDLKDDALMALHEAQALDITFIDAHREKLKTKCTYHEQDWHPFEELYCCKECRFTKDHYYSLYFATLKESPNTGGLHMPYSLGREHGMPDRKTLKPADHDRAEAYGRKLDEDEVAIFPLAKITQEVERLIRLVAPDVVSEETDVAKS